MTVTLRNVSGLAREVGDVVVDDDALLEVKGDLADEQTAPDAYLIVSRGEVRAWPHAHWSDETPTPSKRSK